MPVNRISIPNDFPFVAVLWDDAGGVSSAFVDKQTVMGVHHAIPIIDTGWALVDDESGISLFTATSTNDGEYRGHTFIPRSLVRSVRVILKASKPHSHSTDKAPTAVPAVPIPLPQRKDTE